MTSLADLDHFADASKMIPRVLVTVFTGLDGFFYYLEKIAPLGVLKEVMKSLANQNSIPCSCRAIASMACQF